MIKPILILYAFFFVCSVFAEGTKELMPFPSDSVGRGVIIVSKGISSGGVYGHFAVSTAPEDSRIWFKINSTSEKVYLGMKWIYTNSANYVIKRANGTIAKPSAPVPTSGAGFINNYYKAIAGPSNVATGGYTAILWNPPSAGDYYIEFEYTTAGGWGGQDGELRYFDLTVATSGNVAIPGRVYSKNWFLSTQGGTASDIFRGKLYSYSDDQIVTEINFNGIRPYFFRVACNPNGCNNTEPFDQARKSRTGNSTYAQYKIFLNNPDPNVYPTGIMGAVTSVVPINDCDGTMDIQVNVNKSGNVSILVDINPLPGYQPEDILLSADVVANTPNIITWNGNNGLGQPVPNGTSVDIVVTYINGLTNLPMYDIEAAPSGFVINLVRPTGPQPLVYWDDTNLWATGFNFTGCGGTTGCHSWPYDNGDVNTMNTWWYSLSTTLAPINLTYRRSHFIALNHEICNGESYFFAGAQQTTSGVYNEVYTNFMGCDSTRSLTLNVKPGPAVDFGPDTTLCQGATLTLQATTGVGFVYQWSTGATSSSITVSTTGLYSLNATAPNGCSGSDEIYVIAAPVIPTKPIKHN